MGSLLEVKSLTKSYGDKENSFLALDNVSFSVERGHFVLVTGSSGSGKSTLLNQIGLLDKPTAGSIKIDGVDATSLNESQTSLFRSQKLGFVFQFANLLSDLTVLENVMLPVMVAGRKGAKQYAAELIRSVGLEEQMNKRADRISGGQAQRAAIARGLANKPALVLADEPTGNLDSANSEVIVGLLKTMCRKMNQTFLVVTHDPQDFGEVDSIISMKDGQISMSSMKAAVML